MSKHKKYKIHTHRVKSEEEVVRQQGISKKGKTVILSGIALVVIGFVILSMADPAGENFAAHLSPFIIIAGYVLIGIGIVLPEKVVQPPNPNPEN